MDMGYAVFKSLNKGGEETASTAWVFGMTLATLNTEDIEHTGARLLNPWFAWRVLA